jgi:hypothetical protein
MPGFQLLRGVCPKKIGYAQCGTPVPNCDKNNRAIDIAKRAS